MLIKSFLLLAAYLLGSIPTAAWYARFFHNINIKEHGSGNSGATNSMRVLGKKAGIIVLIIDILKGFLPVFIYKNHSGDTQFAMLIGIFIVIGHVFSVFVDFKGGKGVASALGVILAVYPIGALICVPIFMAVVFFTKYVSLGSLVAAFCFVLIIIFRNLNDFPLIVTSCFLFLFLVFTHRSNISRIVNGTENTFKF